MHTGHGVLLGWVSLRLEVELRKQKKRENEQLLRGDRGSKSVISRPPVNDMHGTLADASVVAGQTGRGRRRLRFLLSPPDKVVRKEKAAHRFILPPPRATQQ